MRKYTILTILVISFLIQLPTAEARHRGDRGTEALVAGLVGLGLGLAIAAPRYYESEPAVVDRGYGHRHHHHRSHRGHGGHRGRHYYDEQPRYRRRWGSYRYHNDY
ncbi:hypothetical protein TI03_00920 [Achromatium sp. WMS1]|nr:hypothetical protein TI03_00920 [Achromatium sp. WMS1]